MKKKIICTALATTMLLSQTALAAPWWLSKYRVDYYDGRTESWDKDMNLAENEDVIEYFANFKERKINEINILYNQHSETVKNFVDSLNNYVFAETDLKLDIDELPADEMQRILRDAMKRNIDNGTIAPAFILELSFGDMSL